MVDRLITLWRSESIRRIGLQAGVLALVGAVFVFLGVTAAQNLAARGIASGFAFLDQPAGYDIAFTLIPFELTDTHRKVFIVGLLNTLFVAALGIVLATVLGVLLGVLRLSGNWIVVRLVATYVEVIRNVPLLLQILFWYAVMLMLPRVRESVDIGGVIFLNNRGMELPAPVFGEGFDLVGIAFLAGLGLYTVFAWLTAPSRTGHPRLAPAWLMGGVMMIGLPLIVFFLVDAPLAWDIPEKGRFNFQGGVTVPPSFVALLIALTAYTAAFISEIVRAGIQSVHKGQTEAAAALGLKPSLTMRLIVLPQALRVIIPPTTSQYLNLTKNSSLGIVVGYPDIVATFANTTLNQTGQAIETLALVMAFYLTVSLLISLAMNWYNRSIQLKGARI